jgi:phosphoribosyl 1,2-cyclic phosphate phosphodiesterase
MKVRILGCGTSTGVPKIGSGWGECDPDEPRNRRLRSSILFESAGQRLLVDCGPDLRQQLLDGDIRKIDAVIVTHDHADHVHGIDDLRPIAQALKAPVPVYARADVNAQLRQRFVYAFVQAGYYPPRNDPRELDDEMAFGDARIRFVDQPHGNISSLGLRFDQDGKSIVYCIDYNEMTREMAELYQGAEFMISDCLTRRPHPTHAHLDGVLAWARELNIGQLYLTHMGNGLDYRALVNELPDWAAPAYDGLEIEL